MDMIGPLRGGKVIGRLEPGIEAALRADTKLARRLARPRTGNFTAVLVKLTRLGGHAR
jgi:hypothetical protein